MRINRRDLLKLMALAAPVSGRVFAQSFPSRPVRMVVPFAAGGHARDQEEPLVRHEKGHCRDIAGCARAAGAGSSEHARRQLSSGAARASKARTRQTDDRAFGRRLDHSFRRGVVQIPCADRRGAGAVSRRRPIRAGSSCGRRRYDDQRPFAGSGAHQSRQIARAGGRERAARAANPGYPDLPRSRLAAGDLVVVVLSRRAGRPEAIKTLSMAMGRVLHLPAYRAKLAEFGLEPFELSPAEATAFIARELDKWANLVAAANIQAE